MTSSAAEHGVPEPSATPLGATPTEWGPLLVVSAATFALLMACAGRYGYHRDELYFIAAGNHPDWGYPDQPPLVPLLARAMDWVGGGSVALFRLPSALAAAFVVLLAGMIAARLGASRNGQILAAVATAAGGVVLAMGHLLSTATADLVGWVAVSYLLVRLLLGDDRRLWLLAGLVAGVTAQANILVGFLLLGVAVCLALVGPRSLLRDPFVWAGGAIALALIAPYLIWQAQHGWPQLDVAGNIAAGGSGSSTDRVAFLPMVFLIAGPWFTPIWLSGLKRLVRDRALRSLGWTFLLLVVVFLLLGGKSYYVAGLVPLLLAAGADSVVRRFRRVTIVALVVLSLGIVPVLLPVLPESKVGGVVSLNYDLGETIGWPQFVQQVAGVYRSQPLRTAIVTGNYGEAGAIDHYGALWGLPNAFSGHNAYSRWGHPPDDVPAVTVGIDPALLARACRTLTPLGRIESPHGINNEENGAHLYLCEPGRPWAEMWSWFRHIG